MANDREITVPVSLDAKTFRRFARFDTLRLRRRWVRPAIFAALLLAFGAAALLTRKPQSGMIAAVLIVIGLGLPLVYIGSFLSQVNMQALNNKLGKQGRRVYTVHLERGGLTVPWKDVQRAFRAKGCVYLYVTAARAFLLPDGQASASDGEVWQTLCRRMGQDKCKKI